LQLHHVEPWVIFLILKRDKNPRFHGLKKLFLVPCPLAIREF
jgi:hypothetical protein